MEIKKIIDLRTGEEVEIGGKPLIEVTYSQLVALRNNAQLVAGQQYRITDYETTTTQTDTRSAGHQFDIIVTADNENTLNENARAIQHEGDTYFADSDLNAWELKYSLDNDINRFGWADETNGKGVIYWLKDEFNNECPYDFKNIQFKRYRVSNEDSLVFNFDGLFYGLKDNYGTMITPTGYIADEEDYQWCYTFNWINEDYETTDCSIEGNRTLVNDEGYISGCYNNKFGIVTDYSVYNENPSSEFRILLGNNVIHCGSYNDDEFFYGIYSNTIGNDFYSNTIGNYFNFNTIGNYFNSNTIGNSFCSNTIGNDFYSNTIGNSFYSNTIGNSFYSNTIGNSFYSNTIGNYFYSNTIGNSFYSNTIGNDFNSNTMYDYVQYINIENGVKYIALTSDTEGDSSNYLQNITIKSGIKGASSSNRVVIWVDRNLEYHTTFKPAGSVETEVEI